VDPRRLEDVRDSKVREPAPALLEEENALVACTVMIAHADPSLVPDEWLPELEAHALGDRFGHEHRLGIAKQVKVCVLFQDPKDLGEELFESIVRENLEPVAAR
jgi:hypothetical protein